MMRMLKARGRSVQEKTGNASAAEALSGLSCVKAPSCLEPAEQCLSYAAIVRPSREECWQGTHAFCGRKIYKLPTTGLKITLPMMTAGEVSDLYRNSYSGQAHLGSPQDWRPVQQAQFIYGAGLSGRTGLNVVEMGCAAGYTLYNVRGLSRGGGSLTCFEADPDYKWPVTATFAGAAAEGVRFELKAQLFDGSGLEANSVDLFMSSHTVEHFADPCLWTAALHRVLKPGGLVFTEVPQEYFDPEHRQTRGQFHFLYFSQQVFAAMMTQAGFEQVKIATVRPPVTKWGVAVRSVFRKPV